MGVIHLVECSELNVLHSIAYGLHRQQFPRHEERIGTLTLDRSTHLPVHTETRDTDQVGGKPVPRSGIIGNSHIH